MQEMHDVDPKFVSQLMRRQAQLALAIAAVFLVILLGLPLANALWPKVMSQMVLGFPLSLLILAVLFFPITWALSAIFVKKSEEIEAEQARLHLPAEESE
jgi:uncharacterized membrane protein (DUF485 family)